MSRLPLVPLALVLLGSFVACASSSTTGSFPDPSGDGGKAPDAATQDCTGIPKAQTLSQTCCLGDGVDACGAGLFCAAFDGRTVPTCYADRSRTDGEECSADTNCSSGACNTQVGKCRSLPGTNCSAAVGCAADPKGEAYYCDGTCKPRGFGLCQNYCDAESDCQTSAGLRCDTATHRCVLAFASGPGVGCTPNSGFDDCPSSGQKCVQYGECGPSSGSWTSKKACLGPSDCAANEVCYHSGAVPCPQPFCM